MKIISRNSGFFLLSILVALADQLTKAWVMANFAPFESRVIIPGFFDLIYVTNTGAAFGFLAGEPAWWRQFFFCGLALVALLVLFFTYRQVRTRSRLLALAIGLIGGGAMGNLIDRLRFGAVVDFLDFYVGRYHWPAFNVADSAITIGVALFLFGSLRQPRQGVSGKG